MDDIKTRTRELLVALGMGHEEFQDRCGLGGGFVSRISTMTRKASFEKIKKAFPQVNINWLITGKGEMFGKEPEADKDNIGARLHKFAASLGMNDRQFERAANLSNGYLNKASDTITPATRLNLSNKFPFLNIEWLLTGVGGMVSVSGSVAATVSAKDRLRHYVSTLGIGECRFLARCGMKVKTIDTLPRMIPDGILHQIGSAYPTLNIDWVITGSGRMERKPKPAQRCVMYIPIVRKDTQAEYVMRHTDADFIQGLPTIPMPPADGVSIAFEVSGNDMDDGTSGAYLDGDVIVCSEVARGALLAGETDNIQAFVTPGGVLLRSLVGCDTSALTVTLHALCGSDDTVLGLAEVGKVFAVRWVIRKK